MDQPISSSARESAVGPVEADAVDGVDHGRFGRIGSWSPALAAMTLETKSFTSERFWYDAVEEEKRSIWTKGKGRRVEEDETKRKRGLTCKRFDPENRRVRRYNTSASSAQPRFLFGRWRREGETRTLTSIDPTAYPGFVVEGKQEMTRVCHLRGDSVLCTVWKERLGQLNDEKQTKDKRREGRQRTLTAVAGFRTESRENDTRKRSKREIRSRGKHS